ncbi:ABC transporter ATP-binding protein [Kribbella sp. NPDC051718]|uniref:ABC transporter ATP-binding protein n=1 Tax=Kribbella sp. NPDC051718 TaxID=3155168 RepID=UPI0034168D31
MDDAVPGGSVVEVSGLVKGFGAGTNRLVAVDEVSVRIEPGSVVALTGPSGSGKSTLLHLIGAIEHADGGSVQVDGSEVTTLGRRGLAAYRRSVGFVFQRYHLLPALTAEDNVAAPLLPFRVDFDKRARARELLDVVGIGDRRTALPSQLSGGQQQRVAIARALVASPRLLLADEPTGNLDSARTTEIIDLLLALRDSRGMTVIIATHEPDVATRCDRVIHLQDGRIQ